MEKPSNNYSETKLPPFYAISDVRAGITLCTHLVFGSIKECKDLFRLSLLNVSVYLLHWESF